MLSALIGGRKKEDRGRRFSPLDINKTNKKRDISSQQERITIGKNSFLHPL